MRTAVNAQRLAKRWKAWAVTSPYYLLCKGIGKRLFWGDRIVVLERANVEE